MGRGNKGPCIELGRVQIIQKVKVPHGGVRLGIDADKYLIEYPEHLC